MSAGLREKIRQAVSEECGHRERMETGNDTGALAHHMARLVYEKIKSDVEPTIKICSVCLETDRKNSEIAHRLLSALGLTPRDISYADPMVKALDTIHQLRQGVLSAALPGIERDFTWAVEQLDQGKSIQHPILEGGVISLYGKTTAGVPIYRINVSSLLWTEEKGGPKFARIGAQAKLTYGWESFEPGLQP